MTRGQIAAILETLAKMVRDGDETAVEIQDVRDALDALSLKENFQE